MLPQRPTVRSWAFSLLYCTGAVYNTARLVPRKWNLCALVSKRKQSVGRSNEKVERLTTRRLACAMAAGQKPGIGTRDAGQEAFPLFAQKEAERSQTCSPRSEKVVLSRRWALGSS